MPSIPKLRDCHPLPDTESSTTKLPENVTLPQYHVGKIHHVGLWRVLLSGEMVTMPSPQHRLHESPYAPCKSLFGGPFLGVHVCSTHL